MRLFSCSNCRNVVHFDNTTCVACGMRLAYRPLAFDMVTLSSEPDGSFRSVGVDPVRVQPCVNASYDACNWLVDDDQEAGYCRACRHNVVIPDLTVPDNIVNWRKIELAKHALIYSLLRLGLPLADRTEDPHHGLGFAFLSDDATASEEGSVLTGHAEGLITLNMAEASDAEREKRRVALNEPFRTLSGHFRHEVAHYFWNVLIRDRSQVSSFRTVFGDESADYAAALESYYAEGPPPGWDQGYISTYATSHPWEDFAETFAHYLHIIDALDTADAFGLKTNPKIYGEKQGLVLDETFDSYRARDVRDLVEAWVPLTLAINSINRSMGQPDLYPFVLNEPVMLKLEYIHQLIRSSKGYDPL
ncbi:putative zinc-binding peptidase [Peteryoungia desertarenae]|uniref:Zinc-binding peptidase n=1 Tax=Peteryoungia desertarenae TaxID=1813451 RepID=A0ABX6QII8_9HYPH|nr:putative zinc-binding metallopeptidase [Peteryoungia desertarenae]QLF68381.1 putative zinc-binding peptidase [Peteryoungia desertarenae]